MKAFGFVPALALAAALLAPPLAEAAHRHGPGCGHGRYAPRYSQSYRYGRSYGHRHYGYSRPAPYYYGGGYYGNPYPPAYYGYGYDYGYGYGYYPPPPPPRYYRRPHVGIGFYLRF